MRSTSVPFWKSLHSFYLTLLYASAYSKREPKEKRRRTLLGSVCESRLGETHTSRDLFGNFCTSRSFPFEKSSPRQRKLSTLKFSSATPISGGPPATSNPKNPRQGWRRVLWAEFLGPSFTLARDETFLLRARENLIGFLMCMYVCVCENRHMRNARSNSIPSSHIIVRTFANVIPTFRMLM